MLKLFRHVGESVFIGKDADIKITLLKNNRNSITLGISAPKNIPIYREEILPLNQKKRNLSSYELVYQGGLK